MLENSHVQNEAELVGNKAELIPQNDEEDIQTAEIKDVMLQQNISEIMRVSEQDIEKSFAQMGIVPADAEPVVSEYKERADKLGRRLRAVVAAFTLGVASASGVAHEGENTESNTTAVTQFENVTDAQRRENAIRVPHELQAASLPDEVVMNGEIEDVSEESRTAQKMFEKEIKEEKAVAERIEKGFADENELITFFGELVRSSASEYMAIYGKTDQGKIEILKWKGGGELTIAVKATDVDVEQYRARGYKKLTMMHTHPQTTLELLANKGKTIDRGASLPFSPLDVDVALATEYSNRYGNNSEWMQAMPDAYTYDQIVVDPGGVWRYSVEPSHPHFRELEQERLDTITQNEYGQEFLKKHPDISVEEFHEMVKTALSPDELVRDRAYDSALEKGIDSADFKSLLGAYRSGTFGKDADYTKMQFEVLLGEKTPEEFIAYCKAKGITATYTPHTNATKSN